MLWYKIRFETGAQEDIVSSCDVSHTSEALAIGLKFATLECNEIISYNSFKLLNNENSI